MRRLLQFAVAVFALAASSGCASYSVVAHETETPQNHYVVVRHRSSGGDTLLDCYSKPDGVTWQPTCREVQRQDR